MISTSKGDFKVLFKGLLISCILSLIIIPTVITLSCYLRPDLPSKIMAVTFSFRLQVLLVGLYVGISNAQNKILISSVIGVLYFPITVLTFTRALDLNLSYTIIYGILVNGLVSVLGTIIGQTFIKWKKKRKVS